MAEADRLHAGAVIGGKYKVLRLLGEGGMGSVYEAENSWTHRRVAVKVLLPEYASDAEAARRFLREAQAAAKLSHPHIVDVLDMGRDGDDGALFIVQEMLDGTDLRRRLVEAGRLSPREAVDTLGPVMEALAFAHERGVVHRDLKPENIFLADTPAGVVPTLIDFGISKVGEGEGEPFRTKTGVILGTPWYMSPEQALGRALDGRSDLWSIAVVLYELLTGRCPFEAATPSVALVQIVTQPTPRIETLAPDVPPALAEALHRALERDPAQRFADARAFLAALRACPLPDAPLAGRVDAVANAPTVGSPVIERTPTAAVDPLGSTDPPPALAPVERAPTLPAARPVDLSAAPSAVPAPGPVAPTVLMSPSPTALPVVVAPPSPPPAPNRARRTLGLLILAASLTVTCVASMAFVALSRLRDDPATAVAPATAPTSAPAQAPAEPADPPEVLGAAAQAPPRAPPHGRGGRHRDRNREGRGRDREHRGRWGRGRE